MTQSGGQPQRSVRLRSSRGAIIDAFNVMVLNGHYRSLGVRELAREAHIGRSTFYEHFDDKRDVLVESLQPVLSVLAAAACGPTPPALEAVLEHIGGQASLAVDLFRNYNDRVVIERGLAALIAADIVSAPNVQGRAVAGALARTTIALIVDWLEGGRAYPVGAIASAITQSAAACRRALLG